MWAQSTPPRQPTASWNANIITNATHMANWNMQTRLMRGQKSSMHVRNKICPANELFHRLNPFLRRYVYHSHFPQWETSLSSFLSSFQLLFFSPSVAIVCHVGHIPVYCKILWLQNRRLQQKYNWHWVPIPSFPPPFLSLPESSSRSLLPHMHTAWNSTLLHESNILLKQPEFYVNSYSSFYTNTILLS